MLAADSVNNPVAAVFVFIFIIAPFLYLVVGAMMGRFDQPRQLKVRREINMPLRDMRDGQVGRKGRG